MQKVILDTNVLVAAGFNQASSSGRIIRAVTRGGLELVWDAPTRAETQHIIDQIPPLSWTLFETLFSAQSEFTGLTYPEQFDMVRDPEDRKFAALAAQTGAALISNDEHLLSVRDKLEITILTPTEFIREQNLSEG